MFNSYMTDAVVIKHRTGSSTWGEKSTSSTSVKARVEDVQKLIRDGNGEMIMLQALVYIKDTDDIAVGDKIEINEIDHPILSIKKLKAFSKVAIVEVGVG